MKRIKNSVRKNTPLSLLLLTLIPFSPTQAQNLDCDRIKHTALPNAKITSAVLVPKSEELPEYCKVSGLIYPAINYEIRLPTEDWNNKFYMAGCGGFCGRLLANGKGFANAMNYGLKRNYAVSTMDSGHQGRSSIDGRWAYDNRQGEIDWGYRAVHETAVVTKAVIEAFYNDQPEKSYFSGCSTGGRQANMSAHRYPKDFDGIISGAPALNYSNLVGIYFTWLANKNTDEDGNLIVGSEKADLVGEKVLETCDEIDGIKDNIIDDPEACNFNTETLLCPAYVSNPDEEECLTRKQVDTLNLLYEGPKNSRGEKLTTARLLFGSESSWSTWVTGPYSRKKPSQFWLPLYGGKKAATRYYSENYLRYMGFKDDSNAVQDPMDFDFDTDPTRLKFMGDIYNSDKTNLAEFKKRGGKLLIWHGLSDTAIPATSSMAYFDKLSKVNNGLKNIQNFARLFLMPGTDHCALLPAHGIKDNGFDALTALENWVERNQAPEELLLTKFKGDGSKLWQRPSCPYPAKAKYNGIGDPYSSDSFSCEE